MLGPAGRRTASSPGHKTGREEERRYRFKISTPYMKGGVLFDDFQPKVSWSRAGHGPRGDDAALTPGQVGQVTLEEGPVGGPWVTPTPAKLPFGRRAWHGAS
jgi:hypothetical protein